MAFLARTSGLTAADVGRALIGPLALITWLNRGTLPLVASRTTPGCRR